MRSAKAGGWEGEGWQGWEGTDSRKLTLMESFLKALRHSHVKESAPSSWLHLESLETCPWSACHAESPTTAARALLGLLGLVNV